MLLKLLKRPVSVTMAISVFVVLGIIGVTRLPVSLIPDIDIPQITVQITDRNKSARELDESVVSPLRQSLLNVSGLKAIDSESQDRKASIRLSFEEGKDIDYFFIEVNENVDRAMSSLPLTERPKVFKASATDIPSFFINITLKDDDGSSENHDLTMPVSDRFRNMSDFAENIIAKRIEQLPEVAMVDISGIVNSEILIIPDIDELWKLGVSLSDFEKYISSANVTLPNLTIRDGEYQYNVKFESFASGRKEIESVWFKAGDRILQIKDVAKVIERPAERNGLDTSNGKNAVVFAIIKQKEAKMSDLKKTINTQIEAFRADYPQLEFTITRDQTELLEYSIQSLLQNIILAIILNCIIVFLFMKDLRTPMLVALTIPLSLSLSFFVFYAIGLSVNIISLSGVLLGVGMMVDNSIILTDNITARWRRGESLCNAIINGTDEVAGPMLSSVLTTCAVFIPLVFISGIAGALFFDQAIAITVVLLSSYLVTVTVIPVYYFAVYEKSPAFKPNRFLSSLEFKGASKMYDRIVGWFILNRWTVVIIPSFCAILIAVCIMLMPREKLPPITYRDAIINIDWNEHITLDENHSRVAQLESSVKDLSEQVTSMVGVQQFVLRHSAEQSINQAQIYFKCADAHTLKEAESVLSSTISSLWPMAVAEVQTPDNIFDMIFSDKEPHLLARLRPIGKGGLRVEDIRFTLSEIRSTIPEARIEEIPLKTDVLYISDPELMALYGVKFTDLVSVLKNSLNGNTIFEIVKGTRAIPVVMGTNVREMEDLLATTFINANNINGESVNIPLSSIMKQSWEQDFQSIISGNEGVYYPLPLNVSSREVESTMKRVTQAVRKSGYHEVCFSGSYFSNKQMLKEMSVVLLIAILLLFLILASQFESLVQPFIILSELVIDIALSLCALWLCGVSINLMSLIGLIVICGIVINDSILKIDTINHLTRNGAEIDKAIREAGHRRLKAIIMTSVTTILAVMPFLSRDSMGDELQYPMALVIIVGMTIGTMVSLFFVPAVYSTIYSKR